MPHVQVQETMELKEKEIRSLAAKEVQNYSEYVDCLLDIVEMVEPLVKN